MNRLTKLVLPIFVIMSLLVNCSKSGPTTTADEVIVKTDKIDIHFSRGDSFKNAYIIFGGTEMTQRGAFCKIALSGLDIYTARGIYSKYPDFHLCKSPGAPLAQQAVRDFEIVPANAKVLKNLRKTLAKHRASLHEDGERVCVKLQGESLTLTAAIVREMNRDIINELPPQVHRKYFFVESAELIDAQKALEGK